MISKLNIIKLAFWSLLLSSRSYAMIKKAAEVKDDKLVAHSLLLQNNPPFCVYPPPVHMPSPPLQQKPPVLAPPPLHTKSVWCVAKPTVPHSSLQHALDYACSAGADCAVIQRNGLCYMPNTMLAHASYAFNSYWQRNKRAGGTCDFGGLAILVTVDPSYDKCHFIYS